MYNTLTRRVRGPGVPKSKNEKLGTSVESKNVKAVYLNAKNKKLGTLTWQKRAGAVYPKAQKRN